MVNRGHSFSLPLKSILFSQPGLSVTNVAQRSGGERTRPLPRGGFVVHGVGEMLNMVPPRSSASTCHNTVDIPL